MATQNDLYCGGCLPTTNTSGNNLIARTAACLYYGSDGRNTDTNNIVYIFIFDSASVPSNGNVTSLPATQVLKHVVQVTTGLNWAHGGYTNGEFFFNGCTIVASTTDWPTLTASASGLTLIEADTVLEYGQY